MAKPNPPFWTRLWDRVFGTPVVSPDEIPKHTAKYTTSLQRLQLDSDGLFPFNSKCSHERSNSTRGDSNLDLKAKYGRMRAPDYPGTIFQERYDRSAESLNSRRRADIHPRADIYPGADIYPRALTRRRADTRRHDPPPPYQK